MMVKNTARKAAREAVEVDVTSFMAYFSVGVGSAQISKTRGKLKGVAVGSLFLFAERFHGITPCRSHQLWIGGSEISLGNLYVDGWLALSLVFGIEQTLGFPYTKGIIPSLKVIVS
jgi:hypothetical protein